ncbi:MAG: MBL fold metallo-hydrolase [Thermoleophilia bacterium]|nr:MBL fold metallo-hydrolase [Thermoleophilia bacterium]
MATLVDLRHLGREGVIAAYLHEGREPALVDCGPAVCVPALEAGLTGLGLALADVRHLLLTHIHPDHAGAAGELVRRYPGLSVHVHEVGAPHLVDPERLERSARRLYRDEFDVLFGPIAPVPAANVRVLGSHVLGLEAVPTPGHAWHHVAFFDGEGTCYAGDALGCLLPPGNFLYPASAPPEIDVEAWEASFTAIEARAPVLVRLPHFGEHGDALGIVARARERLREWAGRVAAGASEAEFVAAATRELVEEAGEAAPLYRQLPGFDLSYAGLARYFTKQAERERSA